jgi:hypothetical protein
MEYNNYGKIEYFLQLNENNKYIKNENASDLMKYTKKSIIYFTFSSEKKGYFEELNYNLTYDQFPWNSYLFLNRDLIQCGINKKEDAWYHWKEFGIKEERTYSYINNSNLHQGRLGNIFFVNIFLSLMSKKYNLKCYYKHEKKFNHLGIYYYKGKNIYTKNCLVTDENFLDLYLNKNLEVCNLILKNTWFQTKDFCCILKTHFEKEKRRNKIITKNVFKDRYNSNNDLFIHLRLGDVSEKTKSKKFYYEKALMSMKYNTGYISSDNIKDPFFNELVDKYKLQIIDYDEIKTIMFASTCNNIILSGGTYSWLIGFLAFYSKNIYYPEIEDKWYGDIFSFANWNKI